MHLYLVSSKSTHTHTYTRTYRRCRFLFLCERISNQSLIRLIYRFSSRFFFKRLSHGYRGVDIEVDNKSTVIIDRAPFNPFITRVRKTVHATLQST